MRWKDLTPDEWLRLGFITLVVVVALACVIILREVLRLRLILMGGYNSPLATKIGELCLGGLSSVIRKSQPA